VLRVRGAPGVTTTRSTQPLICAVRQGQSPVLKPPSS
jgi:hypothetical protein